MLYAFPDWRSRSSALFVWLRGFFARARKANEGIAAVQFGILVPILMLIGICTLDLGTGIYRKMQVQNAAQAGAAYAVAHGFSASSITAAVTNATTFSGISAAPSPVEFCGCPTNSGVTEATCNSTCPDSSLAGTYVTVSSQGTYNTILTYPLIPSSFPFAAQAAVRIQ
jgi:Flp pilus assembly protein TadG